jgi:hypothetical protein
MGWLLVLSTLAVGFASAPVFVSWVWGLGEPARDDPLKVLLVCGVALLIAYCYFEVGKRVLRLLWLRIYRKK